MNVKIDYPRMSTSDPLTGEIVRYLFQLTQTLEFAFNETSKELKELKDKLAEMEGNNG